MNKELYEISRKLDLILEALNIDSSLIYPTGRFVVQFRGTQLFESTSYFECLDYIERCGSLSEPYLIKRVEDDSEGGINPFSGKQAKSKNLAK